MKNIIVGQSGGPTAVINSSVAGVYVAGKELGSSHIYGMVHGIEGFLKGEYVDLLEKLDDNGVELLKRTPSAYLGSCRYKLPKIEDNKEVYEKIFAKLEELEIDYFFYIGGNDSMDTIKMLSDYAADNNKPQKFVGIPKTIDNDLPITDHCPGYGSAVKYIAASIKEIIRDNESFGVEKPTVCIVEIMGRHAGWLTAGAALAKGYDCSGVDAIYLPEVDFDLDEFKTRVKKLAETKSSIVIAVSEGITNKDGKFVCELGNSDRAVDAFGHKQLSGCAKTLADIIHEETGLKTRAIEFSTLQRAAAHLASKTDIEEAFNCGYQGVLAADKGVTGEMVVMKRVSDYKIDYELFDIHDIANVEKKIDSSWIDNDNKQLTKAYIDYALPLIQGELEPIYENGLPKHIVLK